MSSATGSMSRASRSKGKEASSRAPSPGRDEELEDMEPSGEMPTQPTVDSSSRRQKKQRAVVEEDDVLPEGLKESDALIFKIRQQISSFFAEGNKHPSNAEIAEAIGEDEDTVTSARKSLSNARKGQKLSGMRKSALKAGFSRRQGASRAEVKGLDVEQSMITPSDVARMATALPLDMSKGSYAQEEIEWRMELMEERIPIGTAREIIAFVEPLFRGVMTDCVERQARTKTQRITPSTMLSALKQYSDLGIFSSCVPPAGLVRYGKEDGVDTVKRGDPESGYLMEASAEEKKKWRSLDKKDNKANEEARVAAFKEIADKKAARKAPPGGEEADAADAAVPPKKKAKRAVAA